MADSSLIFDRKFSPFMGSSLVISSIRFIEKFEDTQLRKHYYTRGLGAGTMRFFELNIYSILGLTATTLQHEVFGHGYRIRDLGKDVAWFYDYKIGFGEGGDFFRYI